MRINETKTVSVGKSVCLFGFFGGFFFIRKVFHSYWNVTIAVDRLQWQLCSEVYCRTNTYPCLIRHSSFYVRYNTWFVFPLYIAWCGRPVYRQKKLTFAKIDLSYRKAFRFNVFKQSFIYTMCILSASSNFDASHSPKLHCYEITHTEQC